MRCGLKKKTFLVTQCIVYKRRRVTSIEAASSQRLKLFCVLFVKNARSIECEEWPAMISIIRV